MPFQIHDRVLRRSLFRGEPIRFGEIVDVYQSARSHHGVVVMLYSVKWDDTKLVEKGYLDCGLELEPLNVGGLLCKT